MDILQGKVLFVSSTFLDMQAERDALRDKVLPALRSNTCGLDNIDICDLRWGINSDGRTEEEADSKVLISCLSVIARCRPYFIVILGERYGWVPDSTLLSRVLEGWMQVPDEQVSVTELEIRFGPLTLDREQFDNVLFCFRNHVEGAPEKYLAENEDNKNKLLRLKEQIRRRVISEFGSEDGHIIEYTLHWDEEKKTVTGIEDFVSGVYNALYAKFMPQWDKLSKLSLPLRDAYATQLKITHDASLPNARPQAVVDIIDSLQRRRRVYIRGGSGSGKSMLFSVVVTECARMGWNVCAVLPDGTKNFSALRQLVIKLEELLSLPSTDGRYTEEEYGDDELDEHIGYNLYARFSELLDEYSRRDMPVLLIASDKSGDYEFPFVRRNIERERRFEYFNARNICYLDSAGGYGCFIDDCVYCTDNMEFSAKCVVQSAFAENFKECDDELLGLILQKSGAATPRYLSLLVNRLVLLDSSEIDYSIPDNPAKAALVRLIRELPETEEELLWKCLELLCDRIDRQFVLRVLSYISLAESITKDEIKYVFEVNGLQWDETAFFRTVFLCPDLIVYTSGGRVKFSERRTKDIFLSHSGGRAAYLKELLAAAKSDKSTEKIAYYYLQIFEDPALTDDELTETLQEYLSRFYLNKFEDDVFLNKNTPCVALEKLCGLVRRDKLAWERLTILTDLASNVAEADWRYLLSGYDLISPVIRLYGEAAGKIRRDYQSGEADAQQAESLLGQLLSKVLTYCFGHENCADAETMMRFSFISAYLAIGQNAAAKKLYEKLNKPLMKSIKLHNSHRQPSGMMLLIRYYSLGGELYSATDRKKSQKYYRRALGFVRRHIPAGEMYAFAPYRLSVSSSVVHRFGIFPTSPGINYSLSEAEDGFSGVGDINELIVGLLKTADHKLNGFMKNLMYREACRLSRYVAETEPSSENDWAAAVVGIFAANNKAEKLAYEYLYYGDRAKLLKYINAISEIYDRALEILRATEEKYHTIDAEDLIAMAVYNKSCLPYARLPREALLEEARRRFNSLYEKTGLARYAKLLKMTDARLSRITNSK